MLIEFLSYNILDYTDNLDLNVSNLVISFVLKQQTFLI